jgi:hypothetical protein
MEFLNIDSLVKPVKKPKGYVVIILAIFILLAVAYAMGGGSSGVELAVVLFGIALIYMLLPVYRFKRNRQEAVSQYASYLKQLKIAEVKKLKNWPELSQASRFMIEQRLEGSDGRPEEKSS